MMLSPLNAILNMAQSNPNIANNPQAQAMLNVVKSGDAQKGEEIARNLCNTMGITPEEATKQAANFFNIPH